MSSACHLLRSRENGSGPFLLSRKSLKFVISSRKDLQLCYSNIVIQQKCYSNISREFNIGRSTVADIVISEDKIRDFVGHLQSEDCVKKRQIVRHAAFPNVDKAVYLWFVQQRADGIPVSGPVLMAKAQQMYEKIHPEIDARDKFKAGTG